MTVAQADAEMARLSFMLGWSKDIHVLAAAALKEIPSDAAVRALNARVTARDDNPKDISDLVGALATGGINDAQLRIDVASTLLSQSPSAQTAEQVFAVLDDLAHTYAPPLEAVALWSFAADRLAVDPSKLVRVLENASARAPHHTGMLRDLARVHERLGDPIRARDYYNRIILVSDVPEERLWAQKQADSVRLQRN